MYLLLVLKGCEFLFSAGMVKKILVMKRVFMLLDKWKLNLFFSWFWGFFSVLKLVLKFEYTGGGVVVSMPWF